MHGANMKNVRQIQTRLSEYIYIYIYIYTHTHRVIQNDCRCFNNLSYTINLRWRYMYFLFNRTTLQVFVTYLTCALYMHPLWFYKHQHDNRVRSKLFAACQRWWFQWLFWFVPSVPGNTRTLSLETAHITFEWNCQMVLLSRIWCAYLPLDNYTPTIILNNPLHCVGRTWKF